MLQLTAGFLSTWLGLRLFGYSRWKNVLTRFSQKSRPAILTFEQAQLLANLSTATARRFLLRTNCLEQSLVIWFLLRRRGIPATLRFGGRKEHDRFAAHAWVEWQNIVLNDEGGVHAEFAPFEEPIALPEKSTR